MNHKINIMIGAICFLIVASIVLFNSDSAQAKTYTVSPTTSPVNKSYTKSKNYNNDTKQYYLLRSYLEKIEDDGGGTLRLKAGLYTISNVLYLPSNTTIKLDDGVVLKKGSSTGKASFSAAKSLFQVVDSFDKKKSVKEYEGTTNSEIIGSGSATIDLNDMEKAHGIIMAHAQNITISGVHFKNNNRGTFIHVIASESVVIKGNQFSNASLYTTVPAVRIESAVKSSAVYSLAWNKYDGTLSDAINVTNNTFTLQYGAVKTTGYVEGKYQTGIKISNNNLSKIKNTAIYMSGWSKPKVTGNTFDDTEGESAQSLYARAVKFPTIKSNHFINSTKVIVFKNIKETEKVNVTSTDASDTSTVQNEASLANKRDLATNKGFGLKDYRIILPTGDYGDSGNELKLVNPDEIRRDVYTFNENSESLDPSYVLRPSYTSITKDYYVLRSVMEQLEAQGGGTLIIEKGEYTITNTLYVPSNVTIELEDGVVLKKALVTDATTMNISSSVFQLVPPSKAAGTGTVGGFDGTKNVKIYSKGRATIDLQNKYFSFAIIMAHTENIYFENIDFKNMNSGHFIELDASKDVMINNCTFKQSVASDALMKEAINLDTPDLATKGFSSKWSNFDRTATLNVTIQNSVFENLDRAIGTHKYSGAGVINGVTYESKPHTNVKIVNNKFNNIRNDAIRILNWSKPVISNNEFKNIAVGESGKRGIIASGAYSPTIKNNSFENIGRSIQFFPWKNRVNAEEYDIVYNDLSDENIAALKTNTGRNLKEYFIRISDQYLVYTNPKKVTIKKN